MKKRTLLLFILLPFLGGFLLANARSTSQPHAVMFQQVNVLPTDMITFSNNGDVYQLTKQTAQQITHNQHLSEPVAIGSNIVAITKTTNYASLLVFDSSGQLVKTLLNGNSGNIDTMSWVTDPVVNPEQTKVAYVSDKDKGLTNVPDNALYVLNIADGKSTNVANPDPYSGGLAHPVWNPTNSNILLYDHYQYDPQSLTPFSTIEQYNKQTGITTTLTVEKLNAYQESFSPDGKRLLFLGRNGDINTVTLYIADVTDTGLTNIQALLTGDIAYPTFSNTGNHIYYLYSSGNKGYNLLTATIQNNKLIKPLTIVNGFQLQGSSSYTVTQTHQ